jgi:hypothetical protein
VLLFVWFGALYGGLYRPLVVASRASGAGAVRRASVASVSLHGFEDYRKKQELDMRNLIRDLRTGEPLAALMEHDFL